MQKISKIQIPSLSPKGKKTGPLTYMCAYLNGPVEFLVVNLFVTIFNLGEYPFIRVMIRHQTSGSVLKIQYYV
jgi:hypothetical protein